MSWDAWLTDDRGHNEGSWNYTHNTSGMIYAVIREAGIELPPDPTPCNWLDRETGTWHWAELPAPADAPEGSTMVTYGLGDLPGPLAATADGTIRDDGDLEPLIRTDVLLDVPVVQAPWIRRGECFDRIAEHHVIPAGQAAREWIDTPLDPELTDQSGYMSPRDDACWRCDDNASATDVGLCLPCHEALRDPTTTAPAPVPVDGWTPEQLIAAVAQLPPVIFPGGALPPVTVHRGSAPDFPAGPFLRPGDTHLWEHDPARFCYHHPRCRRSADLTQPRPTGDWCEPDGCPAAVCGGPHVTHTCTAGDVTSLAADPTPCPFCGHTGAGSTDG